MFVDLIYILLIVDQIYDVEYCEVEQITFLIANHVWKACIDLLCRLDKLFHTLYMKYFIIEK